MGLKQILLKAWDSEYMGVPKMQDPPPPPQQQAEKKPVDVAPKGGRISRPDLSYSSMINGLEKKMRVLQPEYLRTLIPVIRKASKFDSDIAQALYDTVTLVNTGHKIYFDDSVPQAKVDRMRKHLREKGKTWGDGVAGVHGIVNKLISQIMISGALSVEWVPELSPMPGKLPSTLDNLVLVNPETIEFSWNNARKRFVPYQRRTPTNSKSLATNLFKMNPQTFNFFCLMGDEENPYPIPPYMTALRHIETGLVMDLNIDKIMDQLGLLGFFEAQVEPPVRNDGESIGSHETRCETHLDKTKEALQSGLKDGIVVGLKDQHEFKFNATSKDLNGVGELYNQNKRNTATGLKTTPEFLNVSGGKGSETSITVLFSKMVSQSKNIQTMVSACLEFGYSLELRLAGYSFNNLKVKFNPTTISDDLKIQQAIEVKIRNLTALYNQGIVGQDQFADDMGYDKPNQKEPRAPAGDPLGDAKKKADREKDKDKSDRKTRDKNKPVPKDKDADGKK